MRTALSLMLAAGLVVPAGFAQPAASQPAPAPAAPATPTAPADKVIPEGAIPIQVDVIKPAPPWAIPADAKPVATETRPDGLIIEDFVIGEGTTVQPDWAVVIQSKGYFKDGKEFDSTYHSGIPMVAPIVSAVPGIRQGIPGMKVGGKRRLTIPASLAYGDKGSPPADSGRPQIVPPNTDLIFDITLLDVLQIEDLTVGTGEEIRFGATVKAHYRGTLKEDGSEIDSSYTTGQPIEFALRAMNPGWQFGIPGMKVGGKRKLTVPWAMAYGDRGIPGRIPPKADLVFEIEALGVTNPPTAPGPTAPAVPAPGK